MSTSNPNTPSSTTFKPMTITTKPMISHPQEEKQIRQDTVLDIDFACLRTQSHCCAQCVSEANDLNNALRKQVVEQRQIINDLHRIMTVLHNSLKLSLSNSTQTQSVVPKQQEEKQIRQDTALEPEATRNPKRQRLSDENATLRDVWHKRLKQELEATNMGE